MKQEVDSWNPPTVDHENLKTFMIEQLKMSTQDTTYYEKEIEKTKEKSPLEVYKLHVKSIIESIKYHEKEHQKEIERTELKNNWIKNLRKSLKKNFQN